MKKQGKKIGLVKRLCKITAIILAAVMVLFLIVVFIGRGVNAMRFGIKNGIQEEAFVTLGGIEQVIHIRGKDAGNPVIIWLHGGPGWSDAYELAPWQYKMEDDYTFIRWDQRGSGRTVQRNPNAPISLDILIADLDALVDYAAARFGQAVVIVGDSWGSFLGITYASWYPEKIAGFVGVAQPINGAESDRRALVIAYERAMAAGNTGDAAQMRVLYERIKDKNFLNVDDADIGAYMEDLALVQHLPAKYLAPRYESQGYGIFFSPWFGFHEIGELLSVFIVDNNLFLDRNRPLLYAMDEFVPPERLEIPVAFIMGSEDYITNTALVAEYYVRVEAPSKNMFIVEGAGHSPYRLRPEEFVAKLREALAGFGISSMKG